MDFLEAVAIAEQALKPHWHVESGTLYVAPWGWEDAEVFQVVMGAREFLVDGDDAYATEDGPVVLVEKATGEVLLSSYLVEEERLEAMTPVGEGHPED